MNFVHLMDESFMRVNEAAVLFSLTILVLSAFQVSSYLQRFSYHILV